VPTGTVLTNWVFTTIIWLTNETLMFYELHAIIELLTLFCLHCSWYAPFTLVTVTLLSVDIGIALLRHENVPITLPIELHWVKLKALEFTWSEAYIFYWF